MSSAEHDRAAAAARNAWLETAVMFALVGALLLWTVHGVVGGVVGIAGCLGLLTATAAAVYGCRRGVQVRAGLGRARAAGRSQAAMVFPLVIAVVMVLAGTGMLTAH